MENHPQYYDQNTVYENTSPMQNGLNQPNQENQYYLESINTISGSSSEEINPGSYYNANQQ